MRLIKKHSLLVCFALLPFGLSAANYLFSVSNDLKVSFASSNLQYNAAKDAFRFAPQAYSVALLGSEWTDHFAWGTGNHPGKSSNNDASFSRFDDWGLNPIGSDTTLEWRVLTTQEWIYLFVFRPNADRLFAMGSVAGVNGLIILPDSWRLPAGITFKPGLSTNLSEELLDQSSSDLVDLYPFYYAAKKGDGFDLNRYTIEQWRTMQAAGAVFLPCAGLRAHNGRVIGAGKSGSYWSSTPQSSTQAYRIYFYKYSFYPQTLNLRGYGLAVRLVKDYIP